MLYRISVYRWSDFLCRMVHSSMKRSTSDMLMDAIKLASQQTFEQALIASLAKRHGVKVNQLKGYLKHANVVLIRKGKEKGKRT